MKWAVFFVTCTAAPCPSAPSLARAGSGFYLSSDLGANFASGPDLDNSDNDRTTGCDEFHNPLFADVPHCTDPAGRGDSWMSEFDAAEGILAGAAVGDSLRNRLIEQCGPDSRQRRWNSQQRAEHPHRYAVAGHERPLGQLHHLTRTAARGTACAATTLN